MIMTLIWLFIGIVWCVLFDIPMPVFILMIIFFFALQIFIAKFRRDKLNNVVRAELIEITEVYKREAEKTGYSISWDWRHGRDYYRYRNVLDHYECKFRVVYKNGKTGILSCRKDSAAYNELIRKGS